MSIPLAAAAQPRVTCSQATAFLSTALRHTTSWPRGSMNMPRRIGVLAVLVVLLSTSSQARMLRRSTMPARPLGCRDPGCLTCFTGEAGKMHRQRQRPAADLIGPTASMGLLTLHGQTDCPRAMFLLFPQASPVQVAGAQQSTLSLSARLTLSAFSTVSMRARGEKLVLGHCMVEHVRGACSRFSGRQMHPGHWLIRRIPLHFMEHIKPLATRCLGVPPQVTQCTCVPSVLAERRRSSRALRRVPGPRHGPLWWGLITCSTQSETLAAVNIHQRRAH